MNPVWCLAIVVVLLGCSRDAINSAPQFVASPPPAHSDAVSKSQKQKPKTDKPSPAMVTDITPALRGIDETVKLLERRRYILDSQFDMDTK